MLNAFRQAGTILTDKGSDFEVEGTVFLDSGRFPFVPALESKWEGIRAEYLALPGDLFDPWVQQSMHGGGWKVFGLYAVGQPIPGACAVCPNTVRALEQVPGLSMAGFSRLAPRAHVKPHVGWAASVYRLHLGLVVPGGCRLRVAEVTRSWQEGRCLVFDDTVEHEAWNESDSPRGVLLLDFLRPGVRGSIADHVPEEVQEYAARLFAARTASRMDPDVAPSPARVNQPMPLTVPANSSLAEGILASNSRVNRIGD
jgi:beta-hydroxylase